MSGFGEDVTYDTDEHDGLVGWTPTLSLPFEGTIGEFSRYLDDVELFRRPPSRPVFRHYRRWGFESAALDLALRQAMSNLSRLIERSYQPVRYVVSTSLGDPPSIDRLEALLEVYPDLEFKLDPSPEWDRDLIEQIASLDAVRILDCKAVYEGTDFGHEPDAALYERLLEAFPDAVIEDPGIDDETRHLFEGRGERIAWDAPMTSLEAVRDRPLESGWVNIKPSRFGRIETVLDVISHCEEHDISLYGGGQFELGIGREQIQALASVCYPEGPNDVAPGGFNSPFVIEGIETSPLTPPTDVHGFGFSEAE